MEPNKKNSTPDMKNSFNPIIKMIEDKKRIIQTIKNGESLSALKGIKIVSV